MTVLSGKEFNERYPGPCYKFLTEDLTHHGFTYKLGLNVDTNKFNPTKACSRGGLYFFNNPNYFTEFYGFGPKLGIISIPDDALVYAEENKFKADKLVLSEIKTSQKYIIELLEKSGFKIVFDICADAARNGHLEVLKWARANGRFWDVCTCSSAAENGHLEVLKWARENGCPWDAWTCSSAAENGHLEVLKWARENGCPWNENTCSNAAWNGHLDVLKWARENGCPWDSYTYSYAAKNSHLEILK